MTPPIGMKLPTEILFEIIDSQLKEASTFHLAFKWRLVGKMFDDYVKKEAFRECHLVEWHEVRGIGSAPEQLKLTLLRRHVEQCPDTIYAIALNSSLDRILLEPEQSVSQNEQTYKDILMGCTIREPNFPAFLRLLKPPSIENNKDASRSYASYPTRKGKRILGDTPERMRFYLQEDRTGSIIAAIRSNNEPLLDSLLDETQRFGYVPLGGNLMLEGRSNNHVFGHPAEMAAKFGHRRFLLKLLRHAFQVTMPSTMAFPPVQLRSLVDYTETCNKALVAACGGGHADIVDLMIARICSHGHEFGEYLYRPSAYHFTIPPRKLEPLLRQCVFAAAEGNHPTCLETVLDHLGVLLEPAIGGCRVDAIQALRVEAFVRAAANNAINVLGFMLMTGLDVNVYHEGCSALFAAVQSGHHEAISFLLANDANPELSGTFLSGVPKDRSRIDDHVPKYKLLHIAALKGRPVVVAMMAEDYKLYMSPRDWQDMTPLDRAVEAKNLHTSIALLAYGGRCKSFTFANLRELMGGERLVWGDTSFQFIDGKLMRFHHTQPTLVVDVVDDF